MRVKLRNVGVILCMLPFMYCNLELVYFAYLFVFFSRCSLCHAFQRCGPYWLDAGKMVHADVT